MSEHNIAETQTSKNTSSITRAPKGVFENSEGELPSGAKIVRAKRPEFRPKAAPAFFSDGQQKLENATLQAEAAVSRFEADCRVYDADEGRTARFKKEQLEARKEKRQSEVQHCDPLLREIEAGLDGQAEHYSASSLVDSAEWEDASAELAYQHRLSGFDAEMLRKDPKMREQAHELIRARLERYRQERPGGYLVREAPKKEIGKLKILTGHLEEGRFVTKIRKTFTLDEMNDDLVIIPAGAHGARDSSEYEEILPTSPP